MWELDHKEGWEPKNWCFRTVVLEKTLESPLDSREIKSSILKEINPELFIRRTDAEAEALLLWPPDVKSRLIGKDPDTGNSWSQKEKGAAEDEMVGQHHPSMDKNLSKLWEMVENGGAGMLHSMKSQRLRHGSMTAQWHRVRCSSSSTYSGVTFRYCKLKIYLIHLTYQTPYVKCT